MAYPVSIRAVAAPEIVPLSASNRMPRTRPWLQSPPTRTACPFSRREAIVSRGCGPPGERPGLRAVRVEGRREMARVERGGVHRDLQVHAEIDAVQEELERPLVLLVRARRAERHERPAVLQRQGRGEGRAGALSRPEAIGVAGIQGKHLQAGSEGEAQPFDDRRAAEPAAGGRRGHQVPPSVHGVQMRGVALVDVRAALSFHVACTRAHCRGAAPWKRSPGRSASGASRRIPWTAGHRAGRRRIPGRRNRFPGPRTPVSPISIRRWMYSGELCPIEARSYPSRMFSCWRKTGPWDQGPHLKTSYPR